MPTDIWKEIVRLRDARVPAALATIIRAKGSTPAKMTCRMLVLQDGRPIGTVGGGCVEAEVIQAARHVMDTGKPQTLSFRLSGAEAERTGIACGGMLEVMVEPIEEPRVIVLGAGHVGQAVCDLAARTGFQVSVVDDRPDFASKERFPDAEEVIVAGLDALGTSVTVGSQSYILVMTRGHAEDLQVLSWAITTPARYIGVLGSRSKRVAFMKNLADRGISESTREAVRMPIGKDIGAETVEEIAVSIVAELIEVRRERSRAHA
jgi:xanthine dehydrogenase accessory factor